MSDMADLMMMQAMMDNDEGMGTGAKIAIFITVMLIIGLIIFFVVVYTIEPDWAKGIFFDDPDCVNGKWNKEGTACICEKGYMGEKCNIDENCQNGEWNDDETVCICEEGYSGEKCELDYDPYCLNGRWNASKTACNCDPGFTGKFCQVKDTVTVGVDTCPSGFIRSELVKTPICTDERVPCCDGAGCYKIDDYYILGNSPVNEDMEDVEIVEKLCYADDMGGTYRVIEDGEVVETGEIPMLFMTFPTQTQCLNAKRKLAC